MTADDAGDDPFRLPSALGEPGLPPLAEDRLQAKDGLNTYNAYLSGIALEPQGDANFTFTITHAMMPAGEFTVPVKPAGRSMDEMAIEAHDALIDILRQLTFRANRARQAIARHLAPRASTTSTNVTLAPPDDEVF